MTQATNEQWTPARYDGEVLTRWEVSDEGRVRDVPSGAHRRAVRHPDGYMQVSIPGRRQPLKLGRLVLWSFRGPPGRGEETDHINGRPDDNRLEILRWRALALNRRGSSKRQTDVRQGPLTAVSLYADVGVEHRRLSKADPDRAPKQIVDDLLRPALGLAPRAD